MNYYKQFKRQELKRKALHSGKELLTNVLFGGVLVGLFAIVALI